MSDRLDHVLKQALAPKEQPDFRLNQKILNRVKETEEMKREKRKWIPGLVFSLVLALTAGTGVVYAACRLLTPKQVAEERGDNKLAQAFTGEGALEINETQHFSEYDVTLLGMTSGKNIAECITEKNGEILADRTYIVSAVSRTDGVGMPENLSDDAYGDMRFFVSPLIEGCNPALVNIISMDGVYTEFVQDGVLYRLTECANIEIFADRTVYLCVADGDLYNEDAYIFDQKTGEISRSEAYGGVNALFELPLDPALADPEAAEEYLEAFERNSGESAEEGSEEDAYALGSKEAEAFMEKVTPDSIDQYAERLEESVQVIGADEDDVIYEYTAEDGEHLAGIMNREREFPEGKPGMSVRIRYYHDERGVESLKIVTFTLNEDGTVTGAVYLPKEEMYK